MKNKPSIEYISKQIDKIRKRPMYNDKIICLTYGMIAFTLVIYFNGTFADAIVAGLIGIILKIALNFVSKIDNNAPVIMYWFLLSLVYLQFLPLNSTSVKIWI